MRPKTLSPRVLEKDCPVWQLPGVCVSDVVDEGSARATGDEATPTPRMPLLPPPSWFEMPSCPVLVSAPPAPLDHLKARAAPTHPSAQPEHLGSSQWPQELASADGQDEVFSSPKTARAPLAKEAQTCSVCMEALVPGEKVRKLPCGHIYHAGCIDEWLTRCSTTCPADGLPVSFGCAEN